MAVIYGHCSAINFLVCMQRSRAGTKRKCCRVELKHSEAAAVVNIWRQSPWRAGADTSDGPRGHRTNLIGFQVK